MTLEEGRTITCFLPRSSALEIVLRASANTLMRTMAAALGRGLAPVWVVWMGGMGGQVDGGMGLVGSVAVVDDARHRNASNGRRLAAKAIGY